MSTLPQSLAESRARIESLVERFRANRAAYKNPAYNETQTRREFIDPFFKALGWDVDNEAGYAEAYKDVIHEDAIKVGGMTKAPDYCFRIGGVRKFFVEAKKPSVDMKNDPDPYYQLRRYAYSAKLPLSIVTDFEELAIVDCRAKPAPSDKASTGRIRYWYYEEYIDHLQELLDTFSPDGIKKGGLDRLATSAKAKRGTGEVDKEFLKEIEAWRELLARNIALRNPGLTQRELNTAVQLTIDRIIFLRICEDRGIEEYGVLQGLQNGVGIYGRLCELFQRADERYNSGLFHFRPEKGAYTHPDELTLSLAIDDKPLKQILKGLYYPDSPYEFSVLPADILGQVYEQFLGKVIRLTAGHQAKVEDKPEVKKAGGVYYTPTYIVDYIVKNTVGKLLGNTDNTDSPLPGREGIKGRVITPKEASKLRILDPACGSGSFLIGAYEYLMDWHRDWYSENDPEKWAKGKSPRLFAGKNGWQLTTAEKKRILLNNIYGVDIDPQAVEVTKLSLLLKVLEEESQETINAQLKFFRERALPDLGNNIKCGNSLIGTDFYEGQQMGLLDEEERYRINAFDWEHEFPEIMKAGGFDAVIGNPPYVRIQALKEWAPVEVEYYKDRYKTAGKGNYDIYVVMAERGIELLGKQGLLGFILPHKFLTANYGEPLRSLLSAGQHLSQLVNFGEQQVFAGATTYTCLIFLSKTGSDSFIFTKVKGLLAWQSDPESAGRSMILSTNISAKEWSFRTGITETLFQKLNVMPTKLERLASIFVGTQTSADDVYVLENCRTEDNVVYGFSKSLDQEIKVEAAGTKPFLRGKQIRRYASLKTDLCLICPYEISESDSSLISKNAMANQFPLIWSYLGVNKAQLMARERGRFAGENWYAYGYPKSMTLFQRPKIIVPDYNNVASFTFDSDGHFYKTGYGIILNVKEPSPFYLLGLLNSKLLFWFLREIGTSLRGGYVRFWTQYLAHLPIYSINFSDPADKSRHDQMVELVNRMLALNKQLQSAKTAHDKTTFQRQIDATDRQIDRLVYDLYDLTDDEIKIVEGSSSS